MPDDGVALVAAAGAPATPGQAGRTQVLAFVADAATEAVLRVGLLAATPEDIVVLRGDCRFAIKTMSKMDSPVVLLVDIAGEAQPMSALIALSEVVEPDVRVLVIGDRQDVNLYRQLTRTLGVAEYLYKPLSAEVVAQHFGPFIGRGNAAAAQKQGGRLLAITSVCGGAGSTTLAANLAWYLASEARSPTVLVDTNLHTGSAAMLLGSVAGGGLRRALEAPERVDDLLMERIAQQVDDRLAVIAGEEKLTDRPVIADGAARQLLLGLRQRYNYVIMDVPLVPAPWYDEVLDQTRQRVLVMEPTLQSVRDVLRAMALPRGRQQTRQPLIVLNKLGIPGTMTRHQVEAALDQKVGVAVPFLPRAVNAAATLGTPAAEPRGAFRTAIRSLAQEVAASGLAAPPAGWIGRVFGGGKSR